MKVRRVGKTSNGTYIQHRGINTEKGKDNINIDFREKE
jgi:hypothetical protein